MPHIHSLGQTAFCMSGPPQAESLSRVKFCWLPRYLRSVVVITAYPAQPSLRRMAELSLEFLRFPIFAGRRWALLWSHVGVLLLMCNWTTQTPTDQTSAVNWSLLLRLRRIRKAFVCDRWIITACESRLLSCSISMYVCVHKYSLTWRAPLCKPLQH